MTILLILLFLIILLFFLSRTTTNLLYNTFYRLTKRKTLSISLLSILLYPGVVVHELSHLIMAAVLFVPVKDITLVPTVVEGRIQAGSVTVAKADIFRRTLIGIAPLFAGLTALWAVTVYVLPPIPYVCDSDTTSLRGGITDEAISSNGIATLTGYARDTTLCTDSVLPIHSQFSLLISYFLALFLLFSISATMYSSKKDLESLKIMGPILVVTMSILYLFGVSYASLVPVMERANFVYASLVSALFIPLLLHISTMLLLRAVVRHTRSPSSN